VDEASAVVLSEQRGVALVVRVEHFAFIVDHGVQLVGRRFDAVDAGRAVSLGGAVSAS